MRQSNCCDLGSDHCSFPSSQEKHTEKLTQLYEQPLAKLNRDYHEFIKWKESVANYTRVTNGVRFHSIELHSSRCPDSVS